MVKELSKDPTVKSGGRIGSSNEDAEHGVEEYGTPPSISISFCRVCFVVRSLECDNVAEKTALRAVTQCLSLSSALILSRLLLKLFGVSLII